MTVVLTGKLERMKRNEAKAKLESLANGWLSLVKTNLLSQERMLVVNCQGTRTRD